MSNDIHKIIDKDKNFKDFLIYCIESIHILYDHIHILFNQVNIGIHVSAQNESAIRKRDAFIFDLMQLWHLLINEIHTFTTSPRPSENNGSSRIHNIKELLEATVKLRSELNLLPKMDEPTELYRFLRIFDREKVTAQEKTERPKKFALYAGNNRNASTYKHTPLADYEESTLKPLATKLNNDSGQFPQEDSQFYHICIPREDTQVPLNWPILAHEVGHQVMRKEFFEKQTIDTSFLKLVRDRTGESRFPTKFIELTLSITHDDESKKAVLERWLTECWCDIFGYLTTGPAFLLAQRRHFSTMISTMDRRTHPPRYLRILVLLLFAKRFPPDIMEATPLLSNFDSQPATIRLRKNSTKEELLAIQELAMEFHEYFVDFFKIEEKKENPNITEYINRLKHIASMLSEDTVKTLTNRLDQGYPIPSTREEAPHYKEREISVHEIMLAAWLSYEQSVILDILDTITKDFETIRQESISNQWCFFEQSISSIFKRFNQSVLRSLQVSEWVALFKTDDQKEELKGEYTKEDNYNECYPSLLVDHQIEKLIYEEKIKLIPLINLKKQLGSTSLDVRLGTTFQTYQPNQSGVVDFIHQQSVDNIRANSSIRDLDFLDSIVIAPGQFVLAHTMEYIGLPENIGAQLEGRSSFARLGIQVHMTANLIDPGFHGAATFEIYNAGPNPIRLYPGYRIGQLRFFECLKPLNPYNKKTDAKYKGLLEHSSSLLAKDYEIICIKSALDKNKKSDM